MKVRPIRYEGNLAYVPLSRGLEAVVDAADAHLVEGRNWHAYLSPAGTFYALSTKTIAGVKDIIRMHRVLTEAPHGLFVDHRDGDGLNNRRKNIRLATKGQNGCNRGVPANNKSGFKGVYFETYTGRWRAVIMHNKERHRLGRFDTVEQAADAYKAAALRLHGEFANLS